MPAPVDPAGLTFAQLENDIRAKTCDVHLEDGTNTGTPAEQPCRICAEEDVHYRWLMLAVAEIDRLRAAPQVDLKIRQELIDQTAQLSSDIERMKISHEEAFKSISDAYEHVKSQLRTYKAEIARRDQLDAGHLKNSLDNIKETEQQKLKLILKIRGLEDELLAAKNARVSASTSNQELLTRIGELETDLHVHVEQAKRQTRTIEQREEAVRQLQEQLFAAKRRISDLAFGDLACGEPHTLFTLRDENAALKRGLNTAEVLNASKGRRIDELQFNSARDQKLLLIQQGKLSNITTSHERLFVRNVQLEEINAHLGHLVEEFKTTTDTQASVINELRAEMKPLNQRIETLEAQETLIRGDETRYAEAMSTIGKLRTELQKELANGNTQAKIINNMKAEIDKLQEAAVSNMEIVHARDDLKILRGKHADLVERLEHMQRLLDGKERTDVQAFKQAEDELTHKIINLTARITRTEHDLQEKRLMIQKLEEQVRFVEHNNGTLKNVLQENHDTIQGNSKAMNELVMANKALQEAVARLEQENLQPRESETHMEAVLARINSILSVQLPQMSSMYNRGVNRKIMTAAQLNSLNDTIKFFTRVMHEMEAFKLTLPRGDNAFGADPNPPSKSEPTTPHRFDLKYIGMGIQRQMEALMARAFTGANGKTMDVDRMRDRLDLMLCKNPNVPKGSFAVVENVNGTIGVYVRHSNADVVDEWNKVNARELNFSGLFWKP